MPESKRPLKVFLCHAHADRDAVRGLYTRLTKDGVDAWLDKAKLLPGQDWELEIRKAVREADVVVVCLSKQFNQAGFRQKEVRLALDTAMEKPEGEIFIIPARLDECDNLESLRKWHWVDLFEEDGYEMLMRALRARAHKIDTTLQIKRTSLGNKEREVDELESQKSGSKTISSKAIVTDISSIGDDLDSAQPIPDFLLPKPVVSEIAKKTPKEKTKHETAEKPKPKTVQNNLLKNKTENKTSQTITKVSTKEKFEIFLKQKKLPLLFWAIFLGMYALIYLIPWSNVRNFISVLRTILSFSFGLILVFKEETRNDSRFLAISGYLILYGVFGGIITIFDWNAFASITLILLNVTSFLIIILIVGNKVTRKSWGYMATASFLTIFLLISYIPVSLFEPAIAIFALGSAVLLLLDK
ncbi:MAG: TIR domain-containing protein [Anaerolineales bacterium]|nr:TIR domain-containing protein [Anaerolineales bacterium]